MIENSVELYNFNKIFFDNMKEKYATIDKKIKKVENGAP